MVRREGQSQLEVAEARMLAELYLPLWVFASVVAPAEEDRNDLVQEATPG